MAFTSRFVSLFLFGFQAILATLIGVFFKYSGTETYATPVDYFNVSLMAFLGYGLMMAYLRQHSWSAVGFSIYIIVTTIQYYLLWKTFWVSMKDSNYTIDHYLSKQIVVQCLFSAIAVLISYGAFLGRVGLLELMIVIVWHVIGYSANQMLCLQYLYCFDSGKGMIVHTYAAFFGLGVIILLPKEDIEGIPNNRPSYTNNIIASIGAMVLFVFFPAFNSVFSGGTFLQYNLAFYNTLFSLVGSTTGGFIFSGVFRDRINFNDVLNCVVSGGVVIATSANLMLNPGGAIACGVLSSAFTVTTSISLSKLFKGLKIYDTRGVICAHGIPGFLSGVLSTILILIYGANSNANYLNIVVTNQGRDSFLQAGYQMACTALSLGMGFVAGLVTGFTITRTIKYRKDQLFTDTMFWEIDAQKTPLGQLEQVQMGRMDYSIGPESIRSPLYN